MRRSDVHTCECSVFQREASEEIASIRALHDQQNLFLRGKYVQSAK